MAKERTELEREVDRRRNSFQASAHRLFNDNPSPGDGLRVVNALVIASQINEPSPSGGGIDGIVAMIKRDGRRDMWLEFVKLVKLGETANEDQGWNILGDSEGET